MKTVSILVFDGVEELDCVGPYEVFGIAAMFDPTLFKVAMVSANGEAITCVNGLRLLPHYGFDNAPVADIVVVPGGDGSRAVAKDAAVVDWVANAAANAELLASVCTGVRITLAAGPARGKRVATHWSAVDEIRASGQVLEVCDDLRFVRDGNYVSSAGISAGIDMSLWVVGQIASPAFARRVRKELEYEPAPPYMHEV
ncbi:MAG: DJ-1/PfpI family protein [Pseudomonadota bacterium]